MSNSSTINSLVLEDCECTSCMTPQERNHADVQRLIARIRGGY